MVFIQNDGEIWMVAENAIDSSGSTETRVWKTQNGDGERLFSNYNTEIDILWDNNLNNIKKARLQDDNTIVIVHNGS